MAEKKHWAIVGAGNGGQAFAAYLSQKGIEITMYEYSQKTVDEIAAKGGVTLSGKEEGFGAVSLITTDMEKAIEGAEVIWVIQPSQFHKGIAEKMAGCLKDGQTVILNPIAPLGAIEFKNVLDEKGCTADITLAASSTLLFACRIKSEKVMENGEEKTVPVQGEVFINGKKTEVSVAAYPSNKNAQVEALVKDYFPEFKFVDDILAVSFDNVNFAFHPGPTLLYTAMIEKQMDFEYYIDMVPSQVKLIEAIDKERMAICEAYGLKVDDMAQTFRNMYGYEGTLYEMLTNADCYKGIAGPKNMGARYLMEDVPYALKAVKTLAEIAGIQTTAIDTVINLATILVGDKMNEGRTRKNLGLENATVEDVIKMCRG